MLAARNLISTTFMTHEMGHGFGLPDSFDDSNDVMPGCTWCAPGGYMDPFDLMSAMNVHHFQHAEFGASGPGLNAWNLRKLGWLDPARVWDGLPARLTQWRSETTTQAIVIDPEAVIEFRETVRLVPLSMPEAVGFLAAKVGDYLVELRMTEGWDRGLPRSTFLVHRATGGLSVLVTYDKAQQRPDWPQGSVLLPETGERLAALPDASAAPLGLFVEFTQVDLSSRSGLVRIVYRTRMKRVLKPVPDLALIAIIGSRLGPDDLEIRPGQDFERRGLQPAGGAPQAGITPVAVGTAPGGDAPVRSSQPATDDVMRLIRDRLPD